MTSDKELLELAAKSAGKAGKIVERTYGGQSAYALERSDGTFWVPTHNDGDALRLAVNLGISFCRNDLFVFADLHKDPNDAELGFAFSEDAGKDPYAAARRAIVRAAAEIGRNMK